MPLVYSIDLNIFRRNICNCDSWVASSTTNQRGARDPATAVTNEEDARAARLSGSLLQELPHLGDTLHRRRPAARLLLGIGQNHGAGPGTCYVFADD